MPTVSPDAEPSAAPGAAVPRVADLQLRSPTGPLPARVYWPASPSGAPPRPPLLVLFPAGAPGAVLSGDLPPRPVPSPEGGSSTEAVPSPEGGSSAGPVRSPGGGLSAGAVGSSEGGSSAGAVRSPDGVSSLEGVSLANGLRSPEGGSSAGRRSDHLGGADAACRRLSADAGVVVLAAALRGRPQHLDSAALREATIVTQWAADHAAELDADPGRILVGGEGVGAGLAAAVALHARDEGWPPILRQVLVNPVLDADHDSPSPASPPPSSVSGTSGDADDPGVSPLVASSLAGVAPATVVMVGRGPVDEPGHRYVTWLRDAGVDVDELRYPDLPPAAATPADAIPIDGSAVAAAPGRALTDLADSLRRRLVGTGSDQR